MIDTEAATLLRITKRIVKRADRRGDWTPEEATLCHTVFDVIEAYKRHKEQTAQVAVIHNVTADVGGK